METPRWRFLLLTILCALGVLVVACGGGEPEAPQEEVPSFSLTSDAFGPGEAIPPQYTCDGEDTSPALAWSGALQNAVTFALITEDLDAGGFTHWVLFNLSGDAQGLAEGLPEAERLENGAVQGRNDFGRIGYAGPCPPSGSPHRYRFLLYALDASLDLEPGASKKQVLDSIRDHVLGQAQLVGTYAGVAR